jgi:hypothetical protein
LQVLIEVLVRIFQLPLFRIGLFAVFQLPVLQRIFCTHGCLISSIGVPHPLHLPACHREAAEAANTRAKTLQAASCHQNGVELVMAPSAIPLDHRAKLRQIKDVSIQHILDG